MDLSHLLLLLAGVCLLTFSVRFYRYLNRDVQQVYHHQPMTLLRYYLTLAAVAIAALLTFYYAIFK